MKASALFERYSYYTVRFFLNQFAIALFAAVMTMMVMDMSELGSAVLSLLSVAFYLYLTYSLAWEIGSKDWVSHDCGKLPYFPFRGAIMALIANIPNFLLALLYTVGYGQMAVAEWAGNLCGTVKILMHVLEGMYSGFLLTVPFAGGYLADPWWIYFLLPLPAIAAAFLGYICGHKNLRLIPTKPKKKEPFEGGERPRFK